MTSQKFLYAREIARRGREDVYALKTVDGYKTVRQKVSSLVLEKHVDNRAPIAIYPLKHDTVEFAAFDLDDKGGKLGWETASAAAMQIAAAAEAEGLKPQVFRSGGGHGIHIYFLFMKKQSARSVRKALRRVLAVAGYTEGTLGLARGQVEIFPRQDSTTVDGFGNPIAPPGARGSAPLDQVAFSSLSWDEFDFETMALRLSPDLPEDAEDEARHAATVRLDGDDEEVRQALKYVPSDDYHLWIKIALALKHVFGPEGYGLFEDWSATSSKFKGSADCHRVWNGLKPNGDVGLGTVFFLARSEGWNGPTDQFVREMNAEFGMLIYGNATTIIRKVRGADDESFSIGKGPFLDLLAGQTVQLASGILPKATAWLKHPRASRVLAIDFDPSKPPGDNGSVYNLWTGFAVAPSIEGDWSLLRQHILENICRGDSQRYEWMLNWMALVVQLPGEQVGTAPVLIGMPGTGKGVLAHQFGQLWGRHYITITHPEHVTGRFGGHLFARRFVFIDEGTFGGSAREAGVIKTRITDPWIVLERKGVDAIPIRNRMAFMIASNNMSVVPADKGDRRWMIFEVGDGHREHRAYFSAIVEQMNQGGRGAMLRDLLLRDWSIGPDPRQVIRSEALLEQMLLAQGPEFRYLYCILNEGRLPQNWVLAPNTSTTRAMVEDLWSRFRDAHFVNAIKLGAYISKTIPNLKKTAAGNFYVGNDPSRRPERSTRYTFPPLKQCREAFNQHVGIAVDWLEVHDWVSDPVRANTNTDSDGNPII